MIFHPSSDPFVRKYKERNERITAVPFEISFSPGATATPEHMAELDRDFDSSRFDTEPLRPINKHNLTCEEFEQYLTQSIMKGKHMKMMNQHILWSEKASSNTSSTHKKQKLQISSNNHLGIMLNMRVIPKFPVAPPT